MPVMRTARLVLRPYETGDLDPMAAMFDDPDVTAFTYLGRRSREETAAVLAEYMSFFVDNGFGMFAILDRGTGAYLGECGLFVPPAVAGTEVLALRYALARAGWGNGYATEASAAVIDDAFGRLGLERLIAGVIAENKPSLRVMDKLGFAYQSDVSAGGHVFGLFGLTREEWQGRST